MGVLICMTGHTKMQYSAPARDAMLNRNFDRIAVASKGLAYERLDQLTTEVILGVR